MATKRHKKHPPSLKLRRAGKKDLLISATSFAWPRFPLTPEPEQARLRAGINHLPLTILLLLLFLALSAHAESKMKITFSGYTKNETLTNFPVLVTFSNNVGNSGLDYSTFLNTSGYDLRFWNSNETQELNYEIEEWNTNSNSYVWVQVPLLVDSNTYIWAKWANFSETNQEAYTTNGATWTNGYVGVWHLNETGTSSRRDSSKSALHASASTFEGEEGQFEHIAGYDHFTPLDRLETPSHSNPTAALSYEIWAKSDTANWTGHGTMGSKRDGYVMHPYNDQKKVNFNIFNGYRGTFYGYCNEKLFIFIDRIRNNGHL